MRWIKACALAYLVLWATGTSVVHAAMRIESDIPYAFGVGDSAARKRQSFDLYLPDVARPPIVVFIHGGFWVESDDNYGIGPRLAKALVADGAAVALVRYRLSPSVRHPSHAQDVAAALAAIKQQAGRYGYDAKRIYVVGHSAGATIAALLALDPVYLRNVGMKPTDIAGLVLMSGIYNLSQAGPLTEQHAPILAATFGTDPALRRAASPLTHVRVGPPMLLLNADHDFPGFAADARRFARALRAAGDRQVQDLIIPGQDHFRITDIAKTPLLRALVGAALGLKPLDSSTAEQLQLRRRWEEPPFTSESFWKAGVTVRSFPVDARFRAAMEQIYEQNLYELNAYPGERYHAIDLLEYLQTLPSERVGHGNYLVVTNIRGEKFYLTREQLTAYRPLLVIGLDDERNLFRLNVLYQNRLEYSWREEKPPVMVRPVGAFLHFLKEPPPEVRPSTRAIFSLTPESFSFVDADPFAAIAEFPKEVRTVLTRSNACLTCHSFRGVGARAGHTEAQTGKTHGGFALALESYPPDAWRRFIFEPQVSAKMIGVRPNAVEGPAAQLLYDIVVAERKSSLSAEPVSGR